VGKFPRSRPAGTAVQDVAYAAGSTSRRGRATAKNELERKNIAIETRACRLPPLDQARSRGRKTPASAPSGLLIRPEVAGPRRGGESSIRAPARAGSLIKYPSNILITSLWRRQNSDVGADARGGLHAGPVQKRALRKVAGALFPEAGYVSDREIPGNDHREANSAMEVADVAGADLHRSCARRVGSTRLISRRDDLDRLECGVDREQALDLGRRDVGARQKYQPIQGDQTNNSRLGRDVVVDHFSNPP
jgi:hypothetical protein